jgi:hypothetical protein
LCCSPQLSGTIQHLLTIVALGSVQLTLHDTQPIFRVHGISKVGKNRGMAPHELYLLVSGHCGIWTCTRAEVVVVVVNPAALLLRPDQLPELPEFAS